MATRRYTDLTLHRRLLRQARPFWPHIVLLLIISLLATPLALLAPLPLKIAVDRVVGAEHLPGFLDAVVPSSVARSDTGIFILAAVLTVAVMLLTQLQALGL